MKDYFPYYTIRCTACYVLLPATDIQCAKCTGYRKLLNSMLHKHYQTSDDSTNPGSHTNYRYLNTPEKNDRMRYLRSRARVSLQQTRRITKCLQERIEHTGIQVDDALHDDLSTTMHMEETTSEIQEQYPPGSFPQIFWDQQQQASRLKNAK